MYIDQLFKKAHAKHLQGKYDAATKLYKDLLKIKPNHLDANYLLGTLYAETNQIDKARTYLAIAESFSPASPYIKVNLGNICKIQGDFEEARRYFQEAIALKNDLPQAHFGLGNILENLDNDPDAAYQEYQKALDLSPNDPMILHGVGKTLAKFGNESALEYFSRAHQLAPKMKNLQKDFGTAYLRFGQMPEAVKYLKIAHLEEPEDVHIPYLLCIAEGREPDNELKHLYVQKEFDAYSDSFDYSLTGKLGYDAPQRMLKFLVETLPEALHFRNGVDLGCGTGLFGSVIKEYVDHLTGIDISGKMIEQAQKRNCYDSLIEGEIVSVLKKIDTSFDLFSATDVIIYIGDIEALFSAVKEKASQNALLLLTTESHEGEQFILRNTGRYAHSHEYIKSVSSANGFSIVASREIPLRKEGDNWLAGEMFVLRSIH